MSAMRGSKGTPMTIQHIRQRRPLEIADRLCPDCYSVPGTACRKILSQPGARRLKLGARMPRIHESRRGPATATPAPVEEPAQPTAEERAAQRKAEQWEREKKLWEKDKRARGL
jgi:hypothetical protein